MDVEAEGSGDGGSAKEAEPDVPGSKLADNEWLYDLMLRQLVDDGLTETAASLQAELARALSAATERAPLKQLKRQRLAEVAGLGLQAESAAAEKARKAAGELRLRYDPSTERLQEEKAAPRAAYDCRFVAAHNSPLHCASFSPDGDFVATGSADGHVQVMDVAKVLAAPTGELASRSSGFAAGRAVLQRLAAHGSSVNAVAFHPDAGERKLLSISRDCTMKLWDLAKAGVRAASASYSDSVNLRTLAWHPGGDYVAVGGEHAMIRLYNLQTQGCYVAPEVHEYHLSAVNSLRYSADGRLLASASADGSIKLWDGISNACVRTIALAHGGAEVSSVVFSRSMAYLLSCGRDSSVRLWDVASGKLILAYGNHVQVRYRMQVAFSFNEDYVVTGEDSSYGLAVWDAATGAESELLRGHAAPPRWVEASPARDCFVSASEDRTARFWVPSASSSTAMPAPV
eukprot:PLAT8883.1.p1 GENE.PLAT8883.1~~PLAT8883.1.p1  ORF type:complete len:513 (+),score=196.84 PLAT8883.1:167-1540(+)